MFIRRNVSGFISCIKHHAGFIRRMSFKISVESIIAFLFRRICADRVESRDFTGNFYDVFGNFSSFRKYDNVASVRFLSVNP